MTRLLDRDDPVVPETMPTAYTRLPHDVLRALDRKAAQEGRTRAGLLRHIVTQAVAPQRRGS